jgi:hypothetical protein
MVAVTGSLLASLRMCDTPQNRRFSSGNCLMSIGVFFLDSVTQITALRFTPGSAPAPARAACPCPR